ncbi:MAG TPA: substrate-binding domain-containing protein [Vicinamibacterales bacterium]|jgi:molybdate transport system substrate-binding protein
MRYRVALLVAAALALRVASTTWAQTEITLLSPNPIEMTINKLVADYEAKTGTHVKVTYGTGVSTRTTVASGGALDVSLLFSPFDEALRTGNVVRGSATVIARQRLAIAVRKGAAKPDISTRDAVRRTLLNAKSIISVDPEQGSVGGAVLLTLDKLGLTQQLKPKIKWVPTGGVVQDSVAKGEYELALGPYLSDMRNPGLDVVGALPADASYVVDVTGFLSTSAKDSKAARALLDFLASHDRAPVYESAKLFPAR